MNLNNYLINTINIPTQKELVGYYVSINGIIYECEISCVNNSTKIFYELYNNYYIKVTDDILIYRTYIHLVDVNQIEYLYYIIPLKNNVQIAKEDGLYNIPTTLFYNLVNKYLPVTKHIVELT
jgi:hypothetical protein